MDQRLGADLRLDGHSGPQWDLNRLLLDAGVITDPLPLLHNFAGVLIGMVHVRLPYMVLPIYGAVRRLDPSVVAAAEGLGASSWRIFWRIFAVVIYGILSQLYLIGEWYGLALAHTVLALPFVVLVMEIHMATARNASRKQPEPVGIDELISIKQLAERFGVTPRSVERYVAGGELPELRKIFGERYFRRPQIEEWLGRMFLGRQ